MTHKPFKFSVDIRKNIEVILHISAEQFIRYIHICFMVYVEEKVRNCAFKVL
jgi:hypothetical protein